MVSYRVARLAWLFYTYDGTKNRGYWKIPAFHWATPYPLCELSFFHSLFLSLFQVSHFCNPWRVSHLFSLPTFNRVLLSLPAMRTALTSTTIFFHLWYTNKRWDRSILSMELVFLFLTSFQCALYEVILTTDNKPSLIINNNCYVLWYFSPFVWEPLSSTGIPWLAGWSRVTEFPALLYKTDYTGKYSFYHRLLIRLPLILSIVPLTLWKYWI